VNVARTLAGSTARAEDILRAGMVLLHDLRVAVLEFGILLDADEHLLDVVFAHFG
jgi:hypothetical protein